MTTTRIKNKAMESTISEDEVGESSSDEDYEADKIFHMSHLWPASKSKLSDDVVIFESGSESDEGDKCKNAANSISKSSSNQKQRTEIEKSNLKTVIYIQVLLTVT